MPKEESFLLLSLSDSKAKKVAQVVNNDSCRKILDYLAKTKDATETKIADDLKIPLPTVHYNLKQLVEVKLVNVDEFHYSKKGKEVNHYTLSNKYIIIAPKEDSSIFERLKKMIPAFGVVLAGAFIIKFVEWINQNSSIGAEKASIMVVDEAAPMMMRGALQEEFTNAPSSLSTFLPGVASWFFLGGVLAILAYVIVDWIKDRK